MENMLLKPVQEIYIIDYHKNKITNQIYGGICTEEYYQKAIEVAKAEIKNAQFFFP